MTSMNISLPEPMRAFVEDQVSLGSYGTASEYLRDLIRQDQTHKAEARLEALLLEGLQSPTAPLNDEEWARMRQEVHDRLVKRNTAQTGNNASQTERSIAPDAHP